MPLSASHYYTFHRPSHCELRVYLDARGMEPAPPSPFEEVLRALGERHERYHLATFPEVVDLSEGSFEEREQRTREEVVNGSLVIYQAALKCEAQLHGATWEIVGEPDFLIHEGNGYVIRDCKLSRRITEKDHPEILRQVQLYGWLYSQTFDAEPIRLEVLSGQGSIETLEYDGGETALAELAEIASYATAESEPFSPVGWSKCGDCGYKPQCWPKAEATHDVALVMGVDQGLARTLRDMDVISYEQLLDQFDESTLADVKRPRGKSLRKVGKSAAKIIVAAEALNSGNEILLEPPDLPRIPNYVMFDLEGLPPHLDELEKIYLWGMQVFGENPSDYIAATAGFGEGGDCEGWLSFLEKTGSLLSEYGEIPFVHWHHYERVKLDMYLERFGDKDEIAQIVRRNLLNLLPITQKSIALPLPSYSLKVIEKYVGFKRELADFAGDTAMAKYIQATETNDPTVREEVMNEILAYNKEDLEATWAVMKWLKSK